MSTLSRQSLVARLKSDLAVSPIISEAQIGDTSIDVRLGNQFIVFQRHTLQSYDPYNPDTDLRDLQERRIVRFRDTFVIHPGSITLGATFEYISMPNDLEAQVEGRSSWARLGLIIATATTVEPGFKGVITLELSNVGTIPLVLRPGVRIAQLVFHDAKPSLTAAYAGRKKYIFPIGPEFSRLGNDSDCGLFKRPETARGS